MKTKQNRALDFILLHILGIMHQTVLFGPGHTGDAVLYFYLLPRSNRWAALMKNVKIMRKMAQCLGKMFQLNVVSAGETCLIQAISVISDFFYVCLLSLWPVHWSINARKSLRAHSQKCWRNLGERCCKNCFLWHFLYTNMTEFVSS